MTTNDHDREDQNEQQVADLLRLAGARPDMPSAMQERLSAGFAAELSKQQFARRRRRSFLIALPACAALLLSVIVLFRPSPQMTHSQPVVAQVHDLLGRAQLIRDGETTSLKPGVALRENDQVRTANNALIAVQYGEHRVRVNGRSFLSLAMDGLHLDKGEVYVTSNAVDSDTGLTVRTPHFHVRDIGTQFLVKTTADGAEAWVREGQIVVTAQSDTLQAKADSEHAVHVRLSDATLQHTVAPKFGAVWSWVEKLPESFTLDRKTVHDYLVWVQQESGVQVHYLDQAAKTAAQSTRLAGDLTDGMTALQTLSPVLSTTGLQADILQNGHLNISLKK